MIEDSEASKCAVGYIVNKRQCKGQTFWILPVMFRAGVKVHDTQFRIGYKNSAPVSSVRFWTQSINPGFLEV